ncbi:MAG: argininosuccinate synthase, partial [Planctomycetes bacterium]|nr:argininosuccinate synthase [Planctomycetota bacterium]
MPRVLFAFSGGIDDVLSIDWLRRNKGFQVVALLADLGQGGQLESLAELALEAGAAGTHVVDLRRALLERFVFPCVMAGAHYESYLLATPLARYAICEEMVARAHELGI